MNAIRYLVLTLLFCTTANAKHYMGAAKLSGEKGAEVQIDGYASIKKSEFKSVKVNGALDFEKLKVAGILQVAGAANGEKLECQALLVHGGLEAEDIRAESVKVDGSFAGEDIKISGDLEVNGALSGENYEVKGMTRVAGGLELDESTLVHLEVSGNKVILDDSFVASILIKAESKHKAQKVILNGKTQIAGDIVFESGEGEVELGRDAGVKGQVKGGKITKTN